MDEICRLCLTASSSLSLQYLSLTLTQKIEAVLPVQIIDSDFLPKSICSSCSQQTENIHDFQLKVAANQNLLHRYLREGVRSLSEFYSTLKSNLVKLETGSSIGEKILEIETDTLKTVKNEEIDKKSNRDRVIYTSIPIENENLIKQEDFDNGDDILSDENILLPSKEISNKTVPVKRKKVKVPAKKTKAKVPARKKKDNASTKIKKENTNQSEPPDGSEIKTEIDNNMDDSNAQNDHDENDRFKCLTCFTLLDNKLDLLKHYRKEHSPQENEPEGTQERRYSKVKYNDEYRFKCQKCEYMHHIRWFIQRHVKSHTDKRPFICKICGRTYKSALEIYWHGRAHTTAKWQCYYRCGFTTAYKGALKNHEAVHRAEYRYTCDQCESGFHTRIQLIEHKNKHEGIRPFVCDICGYAFHVRRWMVTPKCATPIKYLQAHKSRLHPQSSSVKRYLCVHCSLPCDTMNALNEHMKAEHQKRTEFLCDLCGKTLTTKEKLFQHKRVHTGARPYECNICGKKLTRKSHLIIHINGHTKERCFRCKCGKKYMQKSALLRHQRTRCRDYVGKTDRVLELFEIEQGKGTFEADAAKYSAGIDESQEAKSTVEAIEEAS